ncbi:MAG: MoxR family ATPase [Pseudomonadota bacterium]
MLQSSHPSEAISRLKRSIEDHLIGRSPLVERMMIALLTGGHVLVEGVPGLAKTRSIRLLAAGLEASFARVQCTPDLMPSDLTGTPVFRPDSGTFEFVEGPIFHNLVLVDEINRAPPKVQSALLEGMAEGQVTSGGETYALPDPFLVMATQNPIEQEGTFPLPEAQRDRFQFHVLVDQPDVQEERQILDLVDAEGSATPQNDAPFALGDLAAARDLVRQVHASPALKDYIVRLVTATREADRCPEVQYAVSPRGSIALLAGARARAWLDGRDYAGPDDVATLASDALAHRMILTWRAEADGQTSRDLIARLLETVEPL